MKGMRALIGGGMLAATMLATPAHAKPAASELRRARANASAGRAAFERGDYQTAIDRFNRAERVIHALPHLLYVARAHEKLAQYFEARDVYLIMLQEELSEDAPKAFKRAQASAREELKALDPKIPRLKIILPKAAPADAKVAIDDSELTPTQLEEAVVVRPGEHTVRIDAAGFEPFYGVVNIPETGGVVPFEAIMKPKAVVALAPVDDRAHVGPLVLLGVGGALLVAGGVTGGLAIARTSQLRDGCPESPCSPELEPLESEASTLTSVATVGLILGGLTAAGGLGWLIAGKNDSGAKKASTTWVEPMIGAGYLGARGRF